eukprot:jgi/Chrzof1/5086/Cz15g10360.t1
MTAHEVQALHHNQYAVFGSCRCLCMGNWKPVSGSENSTLYKGGICANPEGLEHKDRPWCYVDYLTCNEKPAGVVSDVLNAMAGLLHWDYCARENAAGDAAVAAELAPATAAASANATAAATAAATSSGSSSCNLVPIVVPWSGQKTISGSGTTVAGGSSGSAPNAVASRSGERHSLSDERTSWATGIPEHSAAFGTSPVNLTSTTSFNWRRSIGFEDISPWSDTFTSATISSSCASAIIQQPRSWDFSSTSSDRPVQLFLHTVESGELPVRAILRVGSRPTSRVTSASIILPCDPSQADVDFDIDFDRDLSYPANSLIGRGAFGQVHRALYKNKIPVAVKEFNIPEIPASFADPSMPSSFTAELTIMSKLSHPNIVHCYGGNLSSSRPFIVMELCECSLAQMIEAHHAATGEGLPLHTTLEVASDITAALWHIHPSIVHRDLKSQNVLMNSAGVAKIADFGLARMKMSAFLSTRHLDTGTVAYMAPECFDPRGQVNERSDIYALGIILWECLTGQRPWAGYLNQFAVAYEVAHNNGRPPLPDRGDNPHARELNNIIRWCWARNPRERPGSGDLLKTFLGMLRAYVGVPEEGVWQQSSAQ